MKVTLHLLLNILTGKPLMAMIHWWATVSTKQLCAICSNSFRVGLSTSNIAYIGISHANVMSGVSKQRHSCNGVEEGNYHEREKQLLQWRYSFDENLKRLPEPRSNLNDSDYSSHYSDHNHYSKNGVAIILHHVKEDCCPAK